MRNAPVVETDIWAELAERLGLSEAASSRPHRSPPDNRRYQHAPTGLLQRVCADGERTEHLVRIAGTYIGKGHSVDDVIDIARGWNARNDPPLQDEKIVQTCQSILRSDVRNNPERYALGGVDAEPWFDLEEARVQRMVDTDPPPRRWVLPDFLPLGIVGLLAAPGGTSKSQFVLQLAYAVASGEPLLGRWQPAEPAGVLVLCAEDDTDEIHRRLHRVHKAQRDQLKEAGPVAHNLFIKSTVGLPSLLTETKPTGEVGRTALATRLVMTAQQIPNLKLVIVDPCSRFRGGEENKNEDATRFVEALEFVAQTLGATVIGTHHTNKSSSGFDEASQNASRGASALSDGVRWQLALQRLTKDRAKSRLVAEDERATHVELSLVKTNYTAPMEPLLLRRDEGGFLISVSNEQAAGDARRREIAAFVKAIAGYRGGLTARQFEIHLLGRDNPLGMSQKAGRKLLDEMVTEGYLTGGPRQALHPTAKAMALVSAEDAARRGIENSTARKNT
jgi:RecA-family ATPase